MNLMIDLTEPQFLWALLLLPVLWWLSQPPKPRRQVVSAHLAQWQLAMRALRRRPPRGSWLRFALLALAAIGATIAAARPFVPATDGPGKLVVLLDASASMAVMDGEQSAFERARDQLRATLAALPEHIDVTLLRCGGDLRRRHGVAARQCNDLGQPGGGLEVDLVQLAEQTQTDDCVVWTLTDGQGQQQVPAVGALTMLPTAGPNAVITAVRVHDAWPLPTLKLEVDIVAFSLPDAPLAAVLQLSGAVTEPQQIACDLQSSIAQTVTVSVQRAVAGGELLLELQMSGDRLPHDNRHALTLPPLPAPRIAVLAEQDAGPFAMVAAAALADEVAGEVVALEAGVAAGMLLVDGGFVALQAANGELARRRVLTFGTRLSPEATSEPWLSPAPIDWSRSSVLTRGLDLSELRIERAWRNILPDGEAFLWWVDGDNRVPLGVLVDAGETASVHFAFRLEDSNLPLLPAFPQLLRRAFVRSYGQTETSIATPSVSPASEHDLSAPAAADDRALPQFGSQDVGLARWFVCAGLVALAFRAFVR